MDVYHQVTPDIFEFEPGALFQWEEKWNHPCSERWIYALGFPDVDRNENISIKDVKALYEQGFNCNTPPLMLRSTLPKQLT